MKTFKIRHQLFLPEEMSKRLSHLAKSSGRARSDILVEALDAWLTRRASPKSDEAMGIRLTRIERNVEWLRRNQGLIWEVMARLVKHQLIMGAAAPPAKEAVAAGSRLFAELIDEIADRFAGQDPPPTTDPTIHKLRSLQ